MKYFLLIAVLITATVALDQTAWEDWKQQYGKSYESEDEELYRQTIWQTKKVYVDLHNANADQHGYSLEMNEYADMDPVNFAKERNGLLPQPEDRPNTTYYESRGLKLPDTVDWRKEGVVTEVKNQGNCGSCWAFSTTGSLEGQHALKTKNLVSLSEQQLIDCSKKEGNEGCDGGLMIAAFKYIEKNGGDDTEESYPYRAENGRCEFNPKTIGATCKAHVKVAKKDCNALQEAVATIGPISVAMDASQMSLQLYKKGVYDPKHCSETKLDHGVLAVGYGTEDGKDYWLIKNSWGKRWGMEGYFMIARKDNKCGICTAASYPTL